MPVTSTETVATYNGNGSTSIPYPITILRDRDEDLTLLVDGVESTDFTISPDGFRTGVALASTVSLVLFRQTPRTQEQPFPSNTTPAAEDVRAGLDKLTFFIQEVDQEVSRSVRSPIGEMFSSNSTLGLDPDGNYVARTAPQEVDFLGLGNVLSRLFAAESAIRSLGGVAPPVPSNALIHNGGPVTYQGEFVTYN